MMRQLNEMLVNVRRAVKNLVQSLIVQFGLRDLAAYDFNKHWLSFYKIRNMF